MNLFIATDETGATMTGYFGPCPDPLPDPIVYPENTDTFPYQKVVTTADPLYTTYYDTWNGALIGLPPKADPTIS